MTPQDQVSKLRGLLERIQRNAARPRSHAAADASLPAPARAVDLEPPVAPASVAPPAVAISAADQSVDDLLGSDAQPSVPPVDIEVSLESFAPPPPAPLPSETPEPEPIPLVSLATKPEPPSQPASVEEAFALESEVSEVRITTGMREDAEVTVAAIEAEAEPIGTEELSEDDLIEVMEASPAPAAEARDLDIDFPDEEQPPASSQRKVATSMDEALAAAAAQLESDREVPLKTPPPESGPQEAPSPSFTAPPAPDVDALLGGEVDIPTREATFLGPTTEQLGQTIELEEDRGPRLELAEPAASAPPAAAEELEAALPEREVVGSYDDNLLPPPEAQQDLDAHRRSLEDDIPPPPESLATLPSVQPGYAAEIIPVPAAESAGPELIARPSPQGSPESFTSTREVVRPRSFVELLDASLSLNGD